MVRGQSASRRAIAQRFSTPVTALEWNAELCSRGSELSRRLQLDVTLRHCDVLSAAAAGELRQARHAVALHAQWRSAPAPDRNGHRAGHGQSGPVTLLLSPDWRDPLSALLAGGPDSGLALNRDDCRLAVQETVTAAASNRRRRQQKSVLAARFRCCSGGCAAG